MTCCGVQVQDGVCAAWASGRACGGNCERNHCELHSPDFDHALAAGDRYNLQVPFVEDVTPAWHVANVELLSSHNSTKR